MALEAWKEVFDFYRDVIRDLNASGVESAATGGIACIFYGLVQQTKDLDLVVNPGRSETIRHVLAGRSFHGNPVAYMGPFGCPLDDRWLSGGWSSHLCYGRNNTESYPRIDFMSRPPRVDSWQRGVDFECVDADTLSWTKKTQREKDWSVVNSLGVKMIEAGDTRGWLHLHDARILTGLVEQGRHPPQDMRKARPLLQLAVTRSPELRPVLEVEKFQIQQVDHERLREYQTAWKPYGREVNRIWDDIANLPFPEQHQEMVHVAERLLKKEVVGPREMEALIGRAWQETRKQFPHAKKEWISERFRPKVGMRMSL